jgi:hypothetical protein
MLKTIALDPSLFAQWDHHAALRNTFGIPSGRLIAKFPKDWKRLLRESCEAMVQAGTLGAVKAKAIEEWMTSPDGQMQRDTRFAEGSWPYQESQRWSANAEARASGFDAVLSADALEAPNAILADEVHHYLKDERFTVPTQKRVKRRKEDLVACAWPLICAARKVKIVEPHFDPTLPRFRNTLVHLCDRLHKELTRLKEIELHVKRSDDFSQTTLRNYKQYLDRELCSGFKLVIHFWESKRQKLHPRFLLTDAGGLKVDYGWDEGEIDGEETLVDLLSEERRLEEWRRYSLGSEDFDLDPKKHVLMLGS